MRKGTHLITAWRPPHPQPLSRAGARGADFVLNSILSQLPWSREPTFTLEEQGVTGPWLRQASLWMVIFSTRCMQYMI